MAVAWRCGSQPEGVEPFSMGGEGCGIRGGHHSPEQRARTEPCQIRGRSYGVYGASCLRCRLTKLLPRLSGGHVCQYQPLPAPQVAQSTRADDPSWHRCLALSPAGMQAAVLEFFGKDRADEGHAPGD